MDDTNFNDDDDGFDLDAEKQKVKSAADLREFLRILEEEVVMKEPEFRQRRLGDALLAVANRIEAVKPRVI